MKRFFHSKLFVKSNKSTKPKLVRGFTLMVAVIITGIFLIISFTIANITLKEIILTNAGQQSQYAFYASESGVECATYWDLKVSTSSPFNDPPSNISCNGEDILPTIISNNGTVATSTFAVDFEEGCALVTVAKSTSGRTTINSRGYNTCDALALRRFERGVNLVYDSLDTTPVPYTLDITIVGNGAVTDSTNGINCSSTCQVQLNSGTAVNLDASPDSGSIFSGWSEDCLGLFCSLTMNGNHSVTATFEVSTSYDIDYLIVGGGGGGGQSSTGYGIILSGGGGAGGLISGSTSGLVPNTIYNIVVGSGGGPDSEGGDSSVQTLGSAYGGGHGGAYNATLPTLCSSGGSGGGANGYSGSGCVGTLGQGFGGGRAGGAGNSAGGGGGAGGSGQDGSDVTNGWPATGGVGVASSISGVSVTYAVGGSTYAVQASTPGSGGGGATAGNAGTGVNGIVILRHSNSESSSCTGACTTSNSSGDIIYTFTGNGTFTP